MNVDSYLKTHPSLIFAGDMRTVCLPLFNLGIDYFSHARITDQNKVFGNSSNPDFFQHYIALKYHQTDLHTAQFELPQRYIYWGHVERRGKAEESFLLAKSFGITATFSIVEYHSAETNFYHFATNAEKNATQDFYLKYIELLEQFVTYFKHHLLINDRLNRAYQMPLSTKSVKGSEIIKPEYGDLLSPEHIKSFQKSIQRINQPVKTQVKFSRREFQCALYMLEGFTSIEIGARLNISPRTVEVYLERLKKRFASKNKVQLARHLVEAGIINGTL